MKKTVLIFGVSSFVGSNLAESLKDEFRVVGTYHTNPVEIPGVTCYQCDVLKKEYVNSLTGLIKPDVAIYCVGMSSVTECNQRPKFADALNASGAIACCQATERFGAKFIFISSGFVLGGENMLYRESDTPFPNTVLGSSLSQAEFFVQRSCLNYIVLRCAQLYGRSFSQDHMNWFETVQTGYLKNTPIVADDSVTTGFLDISILGQILRSLIQNNVTNRLLQISSKDYMTRFQFTETYAKVFHKDSNLIQKSAIKFPIDNNNKTNAKEMPHYYYQMDPANIEEFLGTKMPLIEDSLRYTLKRLS
jgi:dTDP-4-dehydrorhamnose reductase